MVFKFEQQRLKQMDRPDLARKVRWISQEKGDGAGYDILSFDQKGSERFLEVKTTVGSQTAILFDEERTVVFERAAERVSNLPPVRLFKDPEDV
jgi:hypothetical protein